MATGSNPTETKIINDVADATDDEVLREDEAVVESVPVYKKLAGSKIPVSKHAGPLWKSRKDAGVAKLEKSGKLDNWNECIRYYKNDQRKARTGSTVNPRNRSETDGEAENMVFANTSALVPSTYAKNPRCEVTAIPNDDHQEGGPDDEVRSIATIGERLVNTLASMRASPGFNLKPKARKGVIMTTLTNLSYIEIGYTKRDQSSEEALRDLERISDELVEAKDQQDIERLEGELEALEEKIDFLRPSGPWAKFRRPHDVVRDPDASEPDLSDSKWVMIADYVSTAYINAVYREKTSPTEWKSIYKPTHVVSSDTSKEVEDQINHFSLLKGKESDYKGYGYNDEYSYKKACRTKVWYVWDKIKRRIEMYNDEDWSWPIWVWDDPYNLDTFFPLYPLEFVTDPEDDVGNSETVYYLDQQDAINEKNSELRKIRKRIMNTLFYNKNLIKNSATIDAWVEGSLAKRAIPIDMPPDSDLSKAIFAAVPPSINFLQIFDKTNEFQAIDRLSSVMPVMRGQEFKTNTTNDAIDTYNSQQQTRLDERIDAIEDWTGAIFWGVLQLCLQFMTPDEVASVIGDRDASKWVNLSPPDIRKQFQVRIVGGSTQKPTSKAKKQEAINIGQTLGQFANAGNGAALLLILKVFERAYDEIIITEEDWQFLQQSIIQATANSNPQGQAQQGTGTQQAQVPTEVAGQVPSPQTLPPEVLAIIEQLPDEAKQALANALQQGVPIEEALPRIMELIEQSAVGQA